MRPFEAALKGAREIGFTIVSITFSLIAVFIPVLLMGGIVGRVFREFAVTIAVAIVLSGFVSLTLTPMLCARVLRGHHEGDEEADLRAALVRTRVSGWLRGYEWALDQVLHYKPITLLVTFATIGGTVWLYIAIPKGFFPREDTGYMLAITEGAVRHVVRRHGGPAAPGRRDPAGRPGGALRQFDGRRRRPQLHAQPGPHAGGAQAQARARVSSTTSLRACAARPTRSPAWPSSIQMIQNINVGGRINKSQYQYTLQSSDTETLYKLAPELREKISHAARPARRHHRPLRHQSAGDDRGRPREGGGLRRHHRPGAPGAVQRLRQPPGRDHLHAEQRLSGDPGDQAASFAPTSPACKTST